MDVLGTRELELLVQEPHGPCVSIYLPTHVSGEAVQQDAIRLKNLLQQAEMQLSNGWLRPPEARDLLAQVAELPNDPVFWRDRTEALAIFVAPTSFHRYRLPMTVKEQVRVGQRFHITPLLPSLAARNSFLLLTLSENRVRLLRASQYSIEEVEVPEMPAGIDEALNIAAAERGSQVHSAMRGSLGKQAAVFHGQGGQADSHKDELTQYLRMVDTALKPVLRDETAPLMLAAVQTLVPLYHEVNSYQHLVDKTVSGNFDNSTPQQLLAAAWPVIAPIFETDRMKAAAKFAKWVGTGKASDDISQVLAASLEGKIESLFVDVEADQWGRFDETTAKTEVHAQAQSGDEDLLELAARKALACQGKIYAVEPTEMPSPRPVAAVFRY